MVGASTAYYLTQAGHRDVTLVEAVEVAHAASGRAGGFLALDWCDGQNTRQLTRQGANKMFWGAFLGEFSVLMAKGLQNLLFIAVDQEELPPPLQTGDRAGH